AQSAGHAAVNTQSVDQSEENVDPGHLLTGRQANRDGIGQLLHFWKEGDSVAQLRYWAPRRVRAALLFGIGRQRRRLVQGRYIIRTRFEPMHPIFATVIGLSAGGQGVPMAAPGKIL